MFFAKVSLLETIGYNDLQHVPVHKRQIMTLKYSKIKPNNQLSLFLNDIGPWPSLNEISSCDQTVYNDRYWKRRCPCHIHLFETNIVLHTMWQMILSFNPTLQNCFVQVVLVFCSLNQFHSIFFPRFYKRLPFQVEPIIFLPPHVSTETGSNRHNM